MCGLRGESVYVRCAAFAVSSVSGVKGCFRRKGRRSEDNATAEQFGDKTLTVTERVFQFTVNESLKGLLKTTQVEISSGPIGSSCYQGFTVGESYLVYAFGETEKKLGSGACGRTNRLSDAADDLHYLRNLLRGVPEPRVYGSVVRIDANLAGGAAARRVVPMEGIKIRIEGKGKHFEAVTDKQGLYSLAGIPDGKYKAHPLLPKKYMTYFPAEEEFVLGPQKEWSYQRLQQGAAAYASFRIGWNNHLSGRILDSEGNAIVRAKVAVLVAASPLLWLSRGISMTTTPKESTSFPD